MPAQYRLKRKVNSVQVVENGQATQDMPRGYDIEAIRFRLAGTLNVTTNFSGAVRAEAPTQLVKRIELIGDGKNTIASIPLVMLNRGNVNRRGQLGSLTPPSAQTVAAYSIMASAVLDQAIMDGIRQKDSNLRTSGMALLQIRFTFGQTSDCFVAGTGAGNLTNTFVDIYTDEMIEIADANGQITSPLYLQKRSYQDIAIAASNANQQVILPVGNVLRSVLIRSEGFTTAGEPSDLVINNLTLASGVDVRVNLPYQDAREANKMDYDISTLPVGIVILDLMESGGYNAQASEGWDLTNASEAKLTLDVNAGTASKLTIVTTELIR
ncbi:MAG TPA: hypothetical protein VIE69_06960 [Methylophilaceae bacterium]|jgi:hypothetical protein